MPGQVLACPPADALGFVVRFPGWRFSARHPPRRWAGYAGRVGPSAVAPRSLNCVSLPALQQPQWPDRGGLEEVVRRLEGLPPLVLAAECDQLKERLASVARGEAFLLQGGDCAETFAGTTAGSVRGKFQTLLQMAVVLNLCGQRAGGEGRPDGRPVRQAAVSGHRGAGRRGTSGLPGRCGQRHRVHLRGEDA